MLSMLRRLLRHLIPYLGAVSLRILSVWRLLLFAFVTWTLIDTLLVHRRLDGAEQRQAHSKPQSPVRVYIASLHWNNERILRDSWNQGLLDLVSVLGPSHVFVSLYESGSRDGSKDALGQLNKALGAMGVARNITLDKTTHADVMASPPREPGNGWVKTPRGRIELRRISYLARLRNKSLQPLKEMARSGIEYDYVLFLGDVVFTVGSTHSSWAELIGLGSRCACATQYEQSRVCSRMFAGFQQATSVLRYICAEGCRRP